VRRTRAAAYERRTSEEQEWQARRQREADRLESARIAVAQREEAVQVEVFAALQRERAAAEASARHREARERAFEKEMARRERDSAQYHMAVGTLVGALLTLIAATAGYVLILHPHMVRVSRASLRALEEHSAMREELTRAMADQRSKAEALSVELEAARAINARLERDLSVRREAAKKAAEARTAEEE